jgi:hypothetical protein
MAMDWVRAILAALCLACVQGAGSSQAAGAPSPSPAALEMLKKLPATRMGVDRAGNLWVWNRARSSVQFLSPAGDLFGRVSAPDAMAIDADSEWGVLGSFDVNRELRWIRRDGSTRALRFTTQISDVCWTGPHIAAVSFRTAPHRAETWDLQSGTRLKTLGSEEELDPGIGATRVRGILLRYDFVRDRLVTLDSLTGSLQVFKPTC